MRFECTTTTTTTAAASLWLRGRIEEEGGGLLKSLKKRKKTQLSEQEEEEEGGGGLEEDRVSFFLLGTTHTQMKDGEGEGEGGGGGELHWDEVHSARVSNKLNNARLFSFCLRAFSTKKKEKEKKNGNNLISFNLFSFFLSFFFYCYNCVRPGSFIYCWVKQGAEPDRPNHITGPRCCYITFMNLSWSVSSTAAAWDLIDNERLLIYLLQSPSPFSMHQALATGP